jgi:carbon monoxide dehydrogenase subunit G
MELEHSFTVPVPADQAWDVLLDVEQVAPCMPGATLDSVDGDEIKGRIKVKLGPISMTYAGTAHFTERDREAGVVTLQATGKETRGSGTATATVRSELRSHGDQTEVTVHTTLNVTGRPAQFGRGVMADVSSKLIGIFAANLAEMLAAETDPAAAADAQPAESDSPVREQRTEAPRPAAQPSTPAAPTSAEDSLDLFSVAGLPVLKRIAAPAGALLALLTAALIWRRRRRR